MTRYFILRYDSGWLAEVRFFRFENSAKDISSTVQCTVSTNPEMK